MANPWVKNDAANFHCGYNPEFMKRVWAKRREEARRREAEELRRQKEEMDRRRKQEAMERAREQIRREKAEIEAQRQRFEDMAKRAAETLKAAENGLRPVPDIILAKAVEHNLMPSDITGKSRNRDIVDVRQEAMAEAYVERIDLSLSQLSKYFNRDHTSLLHAVKMKGVWRNPGRTYDNKDAA